MLERKTNPNTRSRLLCISISLFYLFFTIQNHAIAAAYYVSNSRGNDNKSGTSVKLPWKTISKVNGFAFQPGDTILLNRGDIWREMLSLHRSGSKDGYITLSAYGTGEKPNILGSELRTSMCDWTRKDNNKWETTASVPTEPAIGPDVGNIIFTMAQGPSLDTSTGIRVFNPKELNSQGKFLFDAVNKKITIYSTRNPAAMYTSLQCAVRFYAISISSQRYVRVENLALRYASRHGICISDADHIDISNCDISYIGGSTQGSARLGNGIEFWGRAENCHVESCSIHEIYDAALTNQWDGSTGPANQNNITYSNNVIWNTESSFEFWNHDSQSVVDGIYFEHNTCLNAGGGWGHNQRLNWRTGWHVCIGNNPAKTTNVFVQYNIFANSIRSHGAPDMLCGIMWRNQKEVSDVLSDNNSWFIETGSIAGVVTNGKSWPFEKHREYVSYLKYNDTTFQDGNSVFVNPLISESNCGSSQPLGKILVFSLFNLNEKQ